MIARMTGETTTQIAVQKSNYSYNDLVFNNRGDAEVVLERMYELLDHFETVSVADLFDLAGELQLHGQQIRLDKSGRRPRPVCSRRIRHSIAKGDYAIRRSHGKRSGKPSSPL